MDLEQVSKFLGIVNAYYPTWKPEVPMSVIATVWQEFLQDYSEADMNKALRLYVSQGNQFAPSNPGVLTSLLVEATDDSLSEAEAWEWIRKAKRDGLYHSQEWFDRMPPDVQAAIGSPGAIEAMAYGKPNENDTVGKSNFLRAYRAVLERKKQDAKIPDRLRDAIGRNKNIGIEGE